MIWKQKGQQDFNKFEDYSSLWSRWTRQFLLALKGVIICHFFWSALALQRLEICLVLPVKQKQDDHLPCVTQWSGSISKVFGFVSVLTEKSYDVLNMDFLRSYQKLNGEYPIYYSMLSIFKKTCCIMYFMFQGLDILEIFGSKGNTTFGFVFVKLSPSAHK